MGLLCVLVVVLLGACDDRDEPAAATPPRTTPTATPEPTTTPAASATLPTATSEPTAPLVAGAFTFELTPETRWQDLFGAFTESEKDCIRSQLGAELVETVSPRLVMSGGETQPWEPLVFACLSQRTAVELMLSSLSESMAELSEEVEQCLRHLLSDIDIAMIVAAPLPDANPANAQAMEAFTIGLLTCIPEPMTSGPPPSVQTDTGMLWSHPTGDFVVNAPTVVDGVVYVGSDDNHVYALNASTGTELWRFETGDVIRSSPTVVGGAVYVGSNDNHVYALDAKTGAELWSQDTGNWVQYSPVASGGIVYVRALADGDQRLHALDALSGERLWVSENPYPYIEEFALSVSGDKVYMPGEFGEFHALDASTGETVWSFGAGSGAESPPTVAEGVVYLTAVNSAHALDEETGEAIWSYGTEMFPARDFPAVVANGIYFFSPDDVLYALDAAIGQLVWSYQASEFIATKPLVAHGMVYTGLEDGRFYAWTPRPAGLSGVAKERVRAWPHLRWLTVYCTRSPTTAI